MLPKPNQTTVELAGMKVAIAIPSYGNQVSVETLRGLTAGFYDFSAIGIKATLLTCSDALLHKSRNILADMFLSTDCEYLLFVDSDMGFDSETLIHLIAGAKLGKHQISAIAGPQKTEEMRFCAELCYPLIEDPSSGFIQVRSVGTAFMLIHRSVLEKMKENCQYFSISVGSETREIHNFFDTKIIDGEFWSEDYLFCKNWTELGNSIWLDARASLKHVGQKIWEGSIASDIRKILSYTQPPRSAKNASSND